MLRPRGVTQNHEEYTKISRSRCPATTTRKSFRPDPTRTPITRPIRRKRWSLALELAGRSSSNSLLTASSQQCKNLFDHRIVPINPAQMAGRPLIGRFTTLVRVGASARVPSDIAWPRDICEQKLKQRAAFGRPHTSPSGRTPSHKAGARELRDRPQACEFANRLEQQKTDEREGASCTT
jgi:hypothetical protein